MEKPFRNIDEVTENIIKEGGLHQPSSMFLENVMQAVEAKKVVAKKYEPLVSTTGWVVFALALVICLLLLYAFPITSFSMAESWKLEEYLSFGDVFSEFKISKTVVYGIGFLALFFIQIPFLRRYALKTIG